jgi:hypothetical protein
LRPELTERLTEIIDGAKATLPRSLPYEQYVQACGMIEAWSQVRDTLIPETVAEIQRS